MDTATVAAYFDLMNQLAELARQSADPRPDLRVSLREEDKGYPTEPDKIDWIATAIRLGEMAYCIEQGRLVQDEDGMVTEMKALRDLEHIRFRAGIVRYNANKSGNADADPLLDTLADADMVLAYRIGVAVYRVRRNGGDIYEERAAVALLLTE